MNEEQFIEFCDKYLSQDKYSDKLKSVFLNDIKRLLKNIKKDQADEIIVCNRIVMLDGKCEPETCYITEGVMGTLQCPFYINRYVGCKLVMGGCSTVELCVNANHKNLVSMAIDYIENHS